MYRRQQGRPAAPSATQNASRKPSGGGKTRKLGDKIYLFLLEYNEKNKETLFSQSGKMTGQTALMVNSIELLNPMYLCRWNMNIQIGWKKSQLIDFA